MALQAPPEWGIEPVPREHRLLGFLDYFALWSSLGVGLLVLEAGALLVPGLSLGQALLAILVGTLIGNLLLALTGVVGSDTGVPTMVLLRPVLGQRGSFLPTIVNLAQLIGWTAFELWVMGLVASHVTQTLFGFSAYGGWLVVFALWCVLLALGGPLVVVREWLEKFGVWAVYLASAWMTYYLLTRADLGALLRQAGTGDMPFLLAVDLVIAMPISWMPLVADYNRFSRERRGAFWGTYLGYLLSNVWFYALGVLIILAPGVLPQGAAGLTPEHLAGAIMATRLGVIALGVILVDETDNGFADIYSAAVSLQNIFPKVRQRYLVLGVGAVALILAAFLTMSQFFGFLLLTGSVFVPLFGVLMADYFVVRRRHYEVDELYRPGGPYWYTGGVNVLGLVAWAGGIAVYQLTARLAPGIGASLPSLIVAFGLYSLLAALCPPRAASGSTSGT
jgi:NCS1 family nucleobase:cation symporter-1